MIDFTHLWFTSFGDSRLKQPLRRIRRQATSFGFSPEHTAIIDETGLDREFVLKMHDKLILGSRGFGYWCWKPQVILQSLRRMPEGDILLYTDVGCHLNAKGHSRFGKILSQIETSGLVTFATSQKSKLWTKGDLLDFFNVRNDTRITESNQIIAGVLLIRKSKETIKLIKDWRTIFLDHFKLACDTPSRSPNLPGFIENRHDQSIFSILCKLQGIRPLPIGTINNDTESSPIQIRGDKTFGWRSYIPLPIKNFVLRFNWIAALNSRLIWRKISRTHE